MLHLKRKKQKAKNNKQGYDTNKNKEMILKPAKITEQKKKDYASQSSLKNGKPRNNNLEPTQTVPHVLEILSVQ